MSDTGPLPHIYITERDLLDTSFIMRDGGLRSLELTLPDATVVISDRAVYRLWTLLPPALRERFVGMMT